MTRNRRFAWFAGCLLVVLAPTLSPGGEGPDTASGEVRIPSGPTVHYDHHFDRNALVDSRLTGETLVAVAHAGGLLRLDARTVKPTGEWFAPVKATCLGRGEGDAVLVGFADGSIRRVDPVTLSVTPVGTVAGAIRWVGWSPGGIVAVGEPMIPTKWANGIERPTKITVVHDLASGKTYRLTESRRDPKAGNETRFDRQASAFLLDSRRRLWLGADRGEWGGWCVRLDLTAGTTTEIEPSQQPADDRAPYWSGIYGFVERPDGQVWAHGGTMHMGMASAFVDRVDGTRAEPLYRGDNAGSRRGFAENKLVSPPGRAVLPITHLVPDRDGQLLVLAFSEVYRVDPEFKDWSKVETLSIRYRQGRPDAVGSYPSVVAVHRIDDRLLCATAQDGYVEIVGNRVIARALPGQIGLDQPAEIVGSAEGTLLLPRDAEDVPGRLGPVGWEQPTLAPPPEPDPNRSAINGARPTWHELRVMVGPNGALSAVGNDGQRTTARLVGGRWEILGREASDLEVASCFVTPDGTLWNAANGELNRFVNGKWTLASFLPWIEADRPTRPDDKGLQLLDVGRAIQAVGDAGPHWLLRDREESRLLRLSHGLDFRDPKLDAVRFKEDGVWLKIHDAIPAAKGELLLATDKGLRRFDVAADSVRPADLPSPGGAITSLARDGHGRVWLGGEGLWLVDGDGKQLHDLGTLPTIGRTRVTTIAADPGHRDGVILALDGRGVVFVRVAPGP